MKTNIGIETTDEERQLIAAYLDRNSATKRLASRNDIKDLVTQFISDIIQRAANGEYDEPSQENIPDTGRHRGDRDDDGRAGDQGLPDRSDPVANFRPSRGDESYLYKGRNPALTEKCREALDIAEQIDQLIWEELEKNRDK